MASSLAMFAAARSMQAGQGIGQAYKTKLFSALQAEAVKNQAREIDKRASVEIGQIFSAGERVASEQTAAFIKGGVKIEGTAMDVLSDTMSDAAEAAYIRRREADYEIIGLEMQRASLKEASSDMNFFLNSLSAAGGAYMGYQTDLASYERASLRNRGTSGTGTGNYAVNYTGGNAQGLA